MTFRFFFRSIDNLDEIFVTMFPDGVIASSFSVGRTKVQYVMYLGISPYFKQLLLSDIKKSDILVLSFDESLNHATQFGNGYVCPLLGLGRKGGQSQILVPVLWATEHMKIFFSILPI